MATLGGAWTFSQNLLSTKLNPEGSLEVTRAPAEVAQKMGEPSAEAVQTVANRSLGSEPWPGKVFALLNQKGGAGKTTLASGRRTGHAGKPRQAARCGPAGLCPRLGTTSAPASSARSLAMEGRARGAATIIPRRRWSSGPNRCGGALMSRRPPAGSASCRQTGKRASLGTRATAAPQQ